jgi:phosphate/sulfate permease
MAFILFITILFLAYSNGANDNFKGVATLALHQEDIQVFVIQIANQY